MIGLAYSGCNDSAADFFLSAGLCFHGAVSSGTLLSMVDIAPNFAGITLGIVSTVSIATGFISPIVFGYITFENQSIKAWQLIFQISAVMLLGSGAIYICFNDTAVQKWNKTPETVDESEELTPLFKSKAMKILWNGDNEVSKDN